MEASKKKKLLVVSAVSAGVLVVLGILMAIPVTRGVLLSPIQLKAAKVRPMDTAFLKFKEAERVRKTADMFDSAKIINNEDPELAKLLFKRSALFAALQQNKKLFTAISAVYPEAKEAENFFIKGSAAVSLLPEIVPVKSAKEVQNLTKDQLPAWGEYVTAFYQNLSMAAAKEIATEVNTAREQLSEEKMMNAAAKLADFTAKADIPSLFTVKAIFLEAVNFAEIHRNQQIVEKMIGLNKSKNILTQTETKELEALSESLSATRGSSYSGFDDYDGAYSKTKSKNFAIPLVVIVISVFVLVILYFVLKILFALAVVGCVIAVIAAIC